ncbi:MAG: hypothetical protein HY459_03965 [Parcubacteria group bacterium]|nr:hypothetical protein [Parcubacteria group bacterium]
MEESSPSSFSTIPWKPAVAVTVVALFLLGAIAWMVRSPKTGEEASPNPSPSLLVGTVVTNEEDNTGEQGGSDEKNLALTHAVLVKNSDGSETFTFTFAKNAPSDAAQAPLLAPPKYNVHQVNQELTLTFEGVETIAVADLDVVANESSLITNVASSLAIDEERLTWKLNLAKNVGIRIHAQGPVLELTLRGGSTEVERSL